MTDQLSRTTLTYTEADGARHFRSDIESLAKYQPGGRLLVALDEIEHLTFDISPAEHWRIDFLPFWQTMRSVHQDTKGTLCFVLGGVNPRILEAERVDRFDNPLFSTVRSHYAQPFPQTAVREMVRRLSKYMGLKCEEALYPRLTEEYGGHPFLVRQACSHLSRLVADRPGEITVQLFETHREQIARQLEKNVRQILNVLAIWYPDEYDMIALLARGDVATFRSYAESSSEFTEHMEGYGLIAEARTAPKITMALVREFLKKHAPKDTHPASEDPEAVLVEISTRRNKIERALRRVLEAGLRFSKGKKAADALLQSLSTERRATLSDFSYAEVWDQLYFSELATVVEKHWDAFQHWFPEDKAKILSRLDHVNRTRADAHAKNLSEDDLAFVRVCFKRLEEALDIPESTPRV